jgi:hypothetical protein
MEKNNQLINRLSTGGVKKCNALRTKNLTQKKRPFSRASRSDGKGVIDRPQKRKRRNTRVQVEEE